MEHELFCSVRWPTATDIGAIEAFLKFVPSVLHYQRWSFEDDVFAFRAMGDNLAFHIGFKFIYRDFATIVSAFEYFGKRTTGPFRGTIAAGLHSFGIQVEADVIQ